MSVAKRMYILVLVTALGLISLTAISYFQTNRVYQSTEFINNQSIPSAELLNQALSDFEKLNGLIWQHMATTDNAKMQAIEIEVATTHQALTDILKKYESVISNEKDRALLTEDLAKLAKYDEMGGRVLTASLENKKNEARDALLEGVGIIKDMQFTLTNHRAYNFELAKLTTEKAATIKQNATLMMLSIALSIVVAVVLLGLFITRTLLKQLGAEPAQLGLLAKNLAEGNLNQTIVVDEKDKMSVAYSIKSLQKTLDGLIQSLNYVSTQHEAGDIDVSVDASRFKGGYEKVADGINHMVAGHISLNKKAMQVVKAFGEGNFDVALEPFPGKQAYINETVEQVRANLQSLIADANMLANAAVEGKLSTRADASQHLGDFRKIVQGVNNTLDAVIGPLNMAAQCVDSISKGNVPTKISEPYNGDFNHLKNNLNQCIDAVNALITDTSALANAAEQGMLSTRAEVNKHQGDFRKIVAGVNNTLDAVINPLNNAAHYVEKISKGEIPEKISEHYNGDFNQLKNNLNQCIDAINHLVTDANMLANAAAAGNISVRADTSKHQGDFRKVVEGVNATLETIVNPIAAVKEAIETINTAANEISSGNSDLSSRTEQQASSLQETAASMNQLSSTVKQNAENAKQANQLALAASNVAIKGGKAVGEVVITMSAINESSRKIEDIISVIDGIAFQTNILALNAAVEAARAGEQGRGFAVVAGEVRNLAQRSSSAAKEIKELITDSVNKTSEGTKQVEDAGQTMQEIVTSVKRVSDIIAEISAASSEQSNGINQVNNAVTHMDEATQQNAALVEEAAAAAESLVDQANALSDVVSVFKFDDVASNYNSARNQTKPSHVKLPEERRAKNSRLRSNSQPAKAQNNEPKIAKNGTNDDESWEAF